MKNHWLYVAAVVAVGSFQAQAQPYDACTPHCYHANTYCPVQIDPNSAFPASYYGPVQCVCGSGYIPYVPGPNEAASGPPLGLECLARCPYDHIRPPGTRGACTVECTGEDSKPDGSQSRCLTRACWRINSWAHDSACDHRKQVAGPYPGNGCGASDETHTNCPFQWSSSGWHASFTDACNNHDVCYQTCGASKPSCDDRFGGDMYKICKKKFKWYNPKRYFCMFNAELMEFAVELCGNNPYRDAQMSLCRCCNAWS